jgi:LacI family transcriptional regulator
MGYAPDPLARGLRGQRSATVGLIGDEIVTAPWAVRMLSGAHDCAKKHGSLLIILNTDSDPELERREVLHLRQRRVDGILYAAMYHREVVVPPELGDLPVILLDAVSADGARTSVVPDEVAGGRAAVDELVSAGHRRVAFIDTVDDIAASRGRRRGFVEGLAAAGLPVDESLIVKAPHSGDGMYEVARALLVRPDPPTGVFCFKDQIALAVYHAAADLGLSIPRDVSVVGFDDAPFIEDTFRPGLTTIALPHYEMGCWAVDQLYAELDARSRGEAVTAPQVKLQGSLVRRGSVAAPHP